MSCDEIGPLLPGFHFAALDAAERASVEEHLAGCPACVGEYLAVKRAIELAEDVPPPAPAVRARLRRAVAVELGLATELAPRRPWERAVAFAFAGGAVVAATLAMRVLTSGPGAPPHALAEVTLDGARR
jgi:anti-sigma factor RsiW